MNSSICSRIIIINHRHHHSHHHHHCHQSIVVTLRIVLLLLLTWSHPSWFLIWQFLVGLEMYAIVKNVRTITFVPYIPAIFTSKTRFFKIDNRNTIPVAYQQRMIKNNFNQNKKLIAINDRKIIANWGGKARHSTLYCGKCYPLVYIGDSIFKTTRMAMYMVVNQKK